MKTIFLQSMKTNTDETERNDVFKRNPGVWTHPVHLNIYITYKYIIYKKKITGDFYFAFAKLSCC